MHAGAIELNSNFKMVAVCDIDAQRQQEAAQRFNCPVYDDYLKMVSKEEIDLACIITRNDQHCAMTCDCLTAGVNVLVTKPWAANAQEASRMIETAKKSGRKLLPWLPARWGCDLRRLKELVDSDVVGKVFTVRRTVSSFGTRSDWQTEKKFAGGYLLNWGPHIVDPPLVLLERKPVRVYGHMMQTINPGDVEDAFFAAITLSNGAVVVAEYAVSAETLPSWVVQGTKGTIVVHGNKLTLHQSVPQKPADPTQFSDMQKKEDSIVEETLEGDLYGNADEIYAMIADSLTRNKTFAVTVEAGLQLSRVLDAIRKSHEEKILVKLP